MIHLLCHYYTCKGFWGKHTFFVNGNKTNLGGYRTGPCPHHNVTLIMIRGSNSRTAVCSSRPARALATALSKGGVWPVRAAPTPPLLRTFSLYRLISMATNTKGHLLAFFFKRPYLYNRICWIWLGALPPTNRSTASHSHHEYMCCYNDNPLITGLTYARERCWGVTAAHSISISCAGRFLSSLAAQLGLSTV